MTPHRPLLWTALAATLLGCSGTSTATKPASDKADRPAASAHDRLHPGPPKPWAEMSHSERKTYMASTVVPAMAPLFKAYDEAHFADFGCRTCHGDDAIKRGYAMPNSALRTLFPTGSQEQKEK